MWDDEGAPDPEGFADCVQELRDRAARVRLMRRLQAAIDLFWDAEGRREQEVEAYCEIFSALGFGEKRE